MKKEKLFNSLVEQLEGDAYVAEDLVRQIQDSMNQEGKTIENVVSCKITRNDYTDPEEQGCSDSRNVIHFDLKTREENGETYTSNVETCVCYPRTYNIKIEGVVHSNNTEHFITNEEDLIKLIRRTGINNLTVKAEEIKNK